MLPCCAGNVLQYTQLAALLMQAKLYSEAEALLHELLLHVETVKVNKLHFDAMPCRADGRPCHTCSVTLPCHDAMPCHLCYKICHVELLCGLLGRLNRE